MNLKLTIISFLICSNLLGQNNLKKVDLNENYTYQNHSQKELNEYYFGIKPIKYSNVKYHFRYIQYGQIVDLKSNNGLEFSGQLINEITESKTIKTDYGKNTEPTNYVFQVVELDKEKSSKIGQLILREQIHKTPNRYTNR